jgi:hypothetical protein
MIHMSRTKLFMVSLLAVAALSVVTSSTASAHEFLVNGKAIGAEPVEYGGNIQQWQPQFESVLAKLPVHIQCQWGQWPVGSKNVLESGGKYKIFIEFKGCTVTTINSSGEPELQPKCKVAKVTAEGAGELNEAGVLSTSGTKGAEKGFAEIEISEVSGAGACTLTSKPEVKGTQLCSIYHYSFPYLVANVNCNGAGSKELKLGGEPAKLNLQAGIVGTKGQTISSN